MLKKILVANRGEIAVQIIRAIHDMGITAVAVYSEADKDSLFVKLADETVCIGKGPSDDSYLNMLRIINAANLTGCDAIHPGYGFLSENAQFAELCEKCSLKFIGPNYETISLMGDKSKAREKMNDIGVPVIPGSNGAVSSVLEAEKTAKKIGFPVLLKSAMGGGGKGIRRVDHLEDLKSAFYEAQQESRISYNSDEIYIEKLICNAKHVEMQVLSDNYGNVVYLPERDCSVQRNHQKVIEESPCTAISSKERTYLGSIVSQATKEIGYVNTGTYEFLMDESHNFYFVEMNTRIQVEYTVTEAITGFELIKIQIMIASGEKLPIEQKDVLIRGHALECRLNAEDVERNFSPQPGKITNLFFPIGTLGVRIDSGILEGSTVPPYYDSMLAKIIVSLDSRNDAIDKMTRVLSETSIDGIKTNLEFLKFLINTNEFKDGSFNTNFVEENMDSWRGDQNDKS